MARRDAGVSLVSVLVVVAAAALIAGMALPPAAPVTAPRRVDETKAELRLLARAIESYWSDVRAFPATLADLESDPRANASSPGHGNGNGNHGSNGNHGNGNNGHHGDGNQGNGNGNDGSGNGSGSNGNGNGSNGNGNGRNRGAIAFWNGPYATARLSAVPGVSTSLALDGWNSPYELTVTGAVDYDLDGDPSSITIRSAGPDLQAGTADDLVQLVDVTVQRVDETVAEQSVLNAAIAHYNAAYLATAPLPPNLERVLDALYAAGLLPRPAAGTIEPLSADGWGDPYLPVPDRAPVTAVRSSHVGG